ncbi:MAG TPA: protein kinase [Kofleriaceae bacterium]|nr:protein kinase [Kofleriaceae bacterium]
MERRDPLLGTVLDQRFRIDSQIAAGGFGAIYRATDVRSDAEVALKVLHPQLARDPSVVARFRREGKTLANLRDPHTITAYELGEVDDGTLYIVMELLHGESLYHRFRSRGPMPWRQVVHIAQGVCSSLAEAHAAGIVHRDLKPANIHLETRDGDADFVKVLDFGIAKIVQGNEHDRTELTQVGTMIGTIDYMSPEQMVGGEMTPASDIYTLGIVLYEMIAGRTPFATAQTATALLAALLTQTPDPLARHADVPRTLDQIIARCLHREVPDRFRDVTELAEALAAVAAAVPEIDTIADAELAPLPTAGVPSAEFDQIISTTESTRIDVRYKDSFEPVLDARGRRKNLVTPPPHSSTPVIPPPYVAPAVAPTPPMVAPPAHAKGSQNAIDPRPWQPMPDRRGSLPLIGQAAAPSSPVPAAFGPARPVFATPLPAPPAPPTPMPMPAAAMAAAMPLDPMGPMAAAMPMAGAPMTGAPRSRAATYTIRRYDMAADATRDALVRRIIWISLLVAFAIGVLIATH